MANFRIHALIKIPAVILLAFLFTLAPAYAAIQAEDGIPAGFENLAAPRLTSITVYYGGEQLGIFSAHFTPSTVQFDQPEQIVAAIPTISDQPKVLQALRQPLPVNVDRLCTEKRTENCGKLEPEIAGVIFNENQLKAELFINKNFLSVVSSDAARYLPLPDRHIASTDNLEGAVSGTATAAPQFSVTNNNIYSFGEGALATETTLSDQGLRFDEATAGVNRRGWAANTGLFRSQSMQLITDRDIGGVSVSTSRRTLMYDHKTEGNPIIIYLPRRAFVSIYREGRLYSAHDYEAGNQQLDTSELPDGAYNVTIKIQESDGTTREETHFFAKSQTLPSPDQPIYYAQAGFIRKSAEHDSTLPQMTEHPFVRAGTVQRIDANFGLSASLLGVQDRAALETGGFWVGGGSQAQMTFMSSTRGDFGVQAGAVHTADKLNISFDARDVWMSNKQMMGYDTLIRNLVQGEVSLGYSVTDDTTLGFRSSYSRQSNAPNMATVGPYAEWRIWQSGETVLGVSADVARSNNRTEGNLLMSFSYRLGSYGVSGTAGDQYGPSSRGPTGNVRVWHDDPTPGDSLLTSAGINADRSNRVVSADADWRNDVGQVRGGVQHSFGQSGSVTGYGGNFAVSAAQIEDEVHVGGTQNDTSAIVIDTSGDTTTDMNIFVNGMQKGTVKVGEKQTLFLTPFHIYSIRLAPVKSALLDYESNDRKVTLYPGNVVKLEWKVNRFYVVAAHIVTPQNQPVSNAVLQESRTQAATDDHGRIQAELSAPEALTFANADGSYCRATLPKNIQAVNGVLVYRKPLTCVPFVDGKTALGQ